jgi:(E)-4-hydroxy-3-methylbut-2-enyl-diphosphate synthase
MGEKKTTGTPEADAETIVRRKTRGVLAGDLAIGGGAPVVVQEMTVSSAGDPARVLDEIRLLEGLGCRLVRVALPDLRAARAVGTIKKSVRVPLVGDVHFNAEVALAALESGIDKLRLNPGNIGRPENVGKIALAARERGVPIRVGVNSGSLEKDLLERYGGPRPEALAESALRQVSLLERYRFQDIVISIKSSDVMTTIEANRILASKTDYPLHIGITEAGYGEHGALRSAVGIGILLMEGIGDTIRVSLTSRDRSGNLRLCRGILETLRIPYV